VNTRTFRILAGALDSPVPEDKAALAAPLSRATSPFLATIGGQNTNVFFLGLAPGVRGLGAGQYHDAVAAKRELPAGDHW
jgi:hypothetical protein